MIDQVIVVPDLKHENVNVTIVWHGGFRSQHLIYKAVGSYKQLQDYDRLRPVDEHGVLNFVDPLIESALAREGREQVLEEETMFDLGRFRGRVD